MYDMSISFWQRSHCGDFFPLTYFSKKSISSGSKQVFVNIRWKYNKSRKPGCRLICPNFVLETVFCARKCEMMLVLIKVLFDRIFSDMASCTAWYKGLQGSFHAAWYKDLGLMYTYSDRGWRICYILSKLMLSGAHRLTRFLLGSLHRSCAASTYPALDGGQQVKYLRDNQQRKKVNIQLKLPKPIFPN